jgi:hypothetical protein
MVRTLGENDTDVPARSPSEQKGDIDAPHQHKQFREDAGLRSDTCDLMSPLSSIIDIQEAGHDHRSAPHHTCASIPTKRAQPVMFSGSMPWFSGMCLASVSRSVRRNWRYSQVRRVMFSRPYN